MSAYLPNTDNNLIDCPQCGFPAERTKFIIGGEIITNCPFCGYYSSTSSEGRTEFVGCGVVHYNGNSRRVDKEETRESLTAFINKVSATTKYLDVYYWNGEKLETLYGENPRTLDELCEEAIAKAEWDNLCRMGLQEDVDCLPFS